MDKKLRFLFWNICRRSSNIELITRYGQANNIDIITICENDGPIYGDFHGYHVVEHVDNSHDIAILARTGLTVSYTKERDHFCLALIDGEPLINMAIVHLNSPLFSEGEELREIDIDSLLDDLAIEEDKHKNKNTIILGDFNMNPYDKLFTKFKYLNAVFFKCSIGDGTRRKHDCVNDVFYNPMIHVLRDSTDARSPKGSYYYASRWHCFDQVILKKAMAEQIDYDSVCFISKISDNINLVENNKINSSISDHLPLFFELVSKEA